MSHALFTRASLLFASDNKLVNFLEPTGVNWFLLQVNMVSLLFFIKLDQFSVVFYYRADLHYFLCEW